jgi:hypothetical protein
MNRQVAPHDQQRAKNHEPKRLLPIRMVHKLPDEPGTYSFHERLLEHNDPECGVAQPQYDKYPCRYNRHTYPGSSLLVFFSHSSILNLKDHSAWAELLGLVPSGDHAPSSAGLRQIRLPERKA